MVTLDPDVEAIVREAMRDRGQGSQETVNAAIRAGLPRTEQGRFIQAMFSLGFRAEMPYEKALGLAAVLEDQALLRGRDDDRQR